MTIDEVSSKIEQLLVYANNHLYLPESDNIYIRNQFFNLFKVEIEAYSNSAPVEDIYSEVISPLSEYAIESGIIEDVEKDRFETRLFDMVSPRPSQVIEQFDHIAGSENVKTATNWLYNLCCRNNYIRTREIARNKIFLYSDYEHGDLVITINLSKPEKDPRDIAKAKFISNTTYPVCMLCPQNEGYFGRSGYPARNNLRAIPLFLNNEPWFMQFSPYGYYEQHCIVFNKYHVPMSLTADSFARMIDFVDTIPHYFIGSNAPLPIVGGSILSHDHYQGGLKVHPMFKRPLRVQYQHPDYPQVKIGIADWYNSVIRLKSKNREELKKAINYFYEAWQRYDDPSVNIISHTDDTPHNTVTPIIRLERGECYCELILRNNRTDDTHPYGIFHPTEDLHNVKKENIGLIEAIGTFILPGRLANECREMVKFLTGERKLIELESLDETQPMFKHRSAIFSLVTEHGNQLEKNKAEATVLDYLKKVCVQVIKCTAVFKDDELGREAFNKFMLSIGCVPFNPNASQKSVFNSETENIPLEEKKESTDTTKETHTTTLQKNDSEDPSYQKEQVVQEQSEERNIIENPDKTDNTEEADAPKKRKGRPKKVD